LLGCTNLWQAGWQTAIETQPQKIDLQTAALDPSVRYLKVSLNQQEVLMVEAYRQGEESVWVSGDLTIFKTRNGYLRDLEGFAINWQDVRGLNLETAAQLAKPTAYTRVRNEMPGYRFAIRESVLVSPLAQAPKDVRLYGLDASHLRWFTEEVTAPLNGQALSYSYPGVFAIDTRQQPFQVVFGRQCLAKDYCLQWQSVESTSRAKP
jgi:hypothetical protein